MSNTETLKQIKLLSNEPCREDAFEGHSHQTIAAQIARLIKEDEERHIIGVDGGWGSGKSNLISLVNKGLNGDAVYDEGYDHKSSLFPFFVYDAWGHQADYQRRAILEELTQELTIEKKILDGKKWKGKLEELLAKRKKTTTKEVPSLGIGIIVGLLLTVLTPLVVFVAGLIPDNLWWVRLLVSVCPYLFGIWYAVHDRKNSLKKNGQECTVSNILKELILIYKDQIKENETYTTVSEKEPSSAEFKAWMDEVDKDLKALNKNLVIVFDNMDRLPSHKVESLWSSIHSFFSDKTYDNIKVLIPFDRQHVNKAFKSEDTNGESYGNDFINKTFDVVFRVPPPIMTDWQQYMADMWKKAFGEDSVLDIAVTQIYDALSKNHTPRKIIAFINEVATVKMTIRDDIPDRYIALFVFGKESIEKDPVGNLLNPDFMGGVKFEYENDPDTLKYLSALYYQLPVDKALDVVFTREATEALDNGHSERLQEMMEHIDMAPILSKAILNVTDVEKASLALASLDAGYGFSDVKDMPVWLKKIWEDLYHKGLTAKMVWNEIKDFHVPMYQHLYDESLADRLIEGYLSIPDEKWNAKQFVETVNQLRENNDIIDQKLEEHKRNVSPKLFLELLRHTQDDYEVYGIDYDKEELDGYLSGLEMQELIDIDVLPYLESESREKLKQTDAKLREWIGDSSVNDAETIKALFTRLKEVHDKPILSDNILDDTRINKCWNNFVDTTDSFKYDLLAMRLIRQGSFSSQYRASFKDIIQEPDDSDVEGMAKVVEYYISYGDLLLLSDTYKNYPILAAAVKKLTDKSYGTSRANVMQCLSHFNRIVEDYELDAATLYKRLDAWSKFFDFKHTSVTTLPSILFETATTVENKLTKALHDACDEYFGSLSQDQWKEHILAEDDTLRIWKLYHPKKYQANYDALKAVLKDYASGTAQRPDKRLVDEWLTICLEVKHSVKGLFNDIGSILKRDSMITKEKLLFLGSYILEYADADKQNDFVSKLIPTEIIDVEVIGFIAEHINRLKECELPDEFKEKVKHLAETSMKDDERIVAICQQIGVNINEQKEDE